MFYDNLVKIYSESEVFGEVVLKDEELETRLNSYEKAEQTWLRAS